MLFEHREPDARRAAPVPRQHSGPLAGSTGISQRLFFINGELQPGGPDDFRLGVLQGGGGSVPCHAGPGNHPDALRFAAAFFDAHLKENRGVAEAVLAARQQCAADPDPTWLFYSVYGELSDSKAQFQ